MEKLILDKRKLIVEIYNADDAMSITGGGNMMIHEEAVTKNGPAKSLHKKHQVFVANRASEDLEVYSMDQWRNANGLEIPGEIGIRRMPSGSRKDF